MMVSSTDLMLTGSSMMPKVQAPSQGAGQTRPVNSGKLLVDIRRLKASYQAPLRTRSFHSGIRLPKGHPDLSVTLWWQKGVPQSMHLAACVCTSTSSFFAKISWKSATRSETPRLGRSPRSTSRKPRLVLATSLLSSIFFGRFPFVVFWNAAMSSMSKLFASAAISSMELLRTLGCFRMRCLRTLSRVISWAGRYSRMVPIGENSPRSRAVFTANLKSLGNTRTNSLAESGHLSRISVALLLFVQLLCASRRD
mmetsp:Transcript_89151/g.212860  ORF Transcript_89151/g.212860 Transcript_89151/m.212860 type:complete len:253 (-) Transcript_89151:4675-5433(-)